MKCKCSKCYNSKFDIPEDIIIATISEDLLIFAGAGVSTEGKGIFKSSLYTDIKTELKIDNNISFSELMQKYCSLPNGRRKLIKTIRDRFDYYKQFTELKNSMYPFYHDISSISTIKDIITTNWDDLFERECDCIPVMYEEDIALLQNNDRKVYKIHGSIENISTMVITQDDYKKCYNKLKNNLLGSKIKELLTRKTVLFIGYSLEDEDFKKIWKFLKEQLGVFQPHFFIVSPDTSMNIKFKEENVTIINTIANEFMSKLKYTLQERKFILDGDIINTSAENLRETILNLHTDTCKYLDEIKNSTLIYCIFYQDGYIHSLDRILGMKNRGIYYLIDYLESSIEFYMKLSEDYYKASNFSDSSYTYGYAMAMDSVLSFYYMLKIDNKHKPKCNFFFLFNKNEIKTLTKLKDRLLKFKNKKIIRSAEKYYTGIGANESKGIDVHHIPFL